LNEKARSRKISPDDVIIRPLKDSDSLEHLTELLHRGYKRLADMGLRYLATYQDVATTRRRISHGDCFVAVYHGHIIGTLTFFPPNAIGGSPWLNRDDVADMGQFAVEPDFQGNGVGSRMIAFMESYARSRGCVELSLDTAESADHLIKWYERLGYRFIEYVEWEITNYRSVVMSKTLLAASDTPKR